MLTPVASSPSASTSSRSEITLASAVPPPGTKPSSTAALVAFKASSIRYFFSLSSVSVAAPTRITATPPDNLGKFSKFQLFPYRS